MPTKAAETDDRRRNFTKATVDAIAPPDERDRVYYSDKKTPHLRLCVTRAGSKVWYWYGRIDGKPERVRLGRWPAMTVDRARTAAKRKSGDVASGRNPAEQRRQDQAETTLGELFELYLTLPTRGRKKRPKAAKTVADYRKVYNNHLIDWKNKRLSSISRQLVKARHTTVGKDAPYQANRMLALLKAMFNAAREDLGWKGDNPAVGITMFDEKQRERFLQADELPRLFAALNDEPNETVADFVRLALFTGARRTNVQEMAWRDIDLERRVWVIPVTKGGDPVTVPLSPPAVDLLQRRLEAANRAAIESMTAKRKKDKPYGYCSIYVLPSRDHQRPLQEPKTAWAEIKKRAKLRDVRLHDLRRSLGSWQAATGASLPIIGKSLGHKSQQATAIYARLSLDPVRDAVDTATAAMMKAGNGEKGGE